MEKQMRRIVEECYYDLAECGDLCAESLADFVGDRMSDESAEYRALPYAQRRAITLQVARDYI